MHANVADEMGRRRQPEEVLPPLKRHEVQVLRRAGHSQAEVERLTGASLRSIRRIESELAVSQVETQVQVKERSVGRPSKAEPFRAFVAALLAADPEVMSLEILRRVKLDGYAGSKTALYELVAVLRPPKEKPIVRFEGVAGEFSQHDFGHVDVRFIDGSKKRVHFFASRLKYSRWAQVTLVENERVESLVRPLVEHFEAFGGVPLLAVFDRPKTVVIKWKKDGTVTEWNSTFAQIILELGVGVELCWPRRGNQKGSVERLVGWVKNSFFKQRRFVDEEDLHQQLIEWQNNVNTIVTSRATGVTPTARIVEERARLRPLKVLPTDLALRIPVTVGPTGYVIYENRRYSMPPESIHLPATLYLYKDRLRIVAGRHAAEHARLWNDGAESTLPEHRAQMLAAVSGKRARRYYKREQLLRLGASVVDYVTELVHRRPKTWIDDIDEIFDILQVVGEDAVRAAIIIALRESAFGAEYVTHFIDPNLVRTPIHPARARSGARRSRKCSKSNAQLPLPLRGSSIEEDT